MIHVCALTGGVHKPSSRFRVRQHVAPLRALGVEVEEVIPRLDKHAEFLPRALMPYKLIRRPAKALMHGIKVASRFTSFRASQRADVVWLQRELVPGIPSWELLMRQPTVFDMDDAIWLAPPAGRFTCKLLAQRVSVIVAGNRYLADWFSQYAKDVRIVPTAVDTDRYGPRERPKDAFTIGWIGTSSNLRYLEELEDALLQVFQTCPDARLSVVCDRAPRFTRLPEARTQWVKWSPEVEVEEIQAMSVGLMPLADEEWTRGKCSFKMLQYMACGLPVVVSPVGMNRDVLDMGTVGFSATRTDEWVTALVELYRDSTAASAMGQTGRAIVEGHFSRSIVSRQLADIFHELH